MNNKEAINILSAISEWHKDKENLPKPFSNYDFMQAISYSIKVLREKEFFDATISCFVFDLENLAILEGKSIGKNIAQMIEQNFIEYKPEAWRLRTEDEPYIHPDNRK